MLEAGTKAPGFTLPDQDGKPVKPEIESAALFVSKDNVDTYKQKK